MSNEQNQGRGQQNRGRRHGGPGRRGGRHQREEREFDQRVVDIARVNRMVAGGRRFRFRTTMLIGDKKGKVGIGLAKGPDVQQSIQKAVTKAKKNMTTLQLNEHNTVPFELEGVFKKARVVIKPAPKGHGVVAGSSARMLCEIAGVEDVSVKIVSRGKNKLNILRATMNAFEQIVLIAKIHGEAAVKVPARVQTAQKKQIKHHTVQSSRSKSKTRNMGSHKGTKAPAPKAKPKSKPVQKSVKK